MLKKPQLLQPLTLNRKTESAAPHTFIKDDSENPSAAAMALSTHVHTDESSTSTNPLSLIHQTIEVVHNEPLRQFLHAVLQESEVRLAVSQFSVLQNKSVRLYRIEQLQRAASISRFGMDWRTEDKEALYAATLIRGIQELLAIQIVGNSCTPSNLMFSIVCKALHRLDDAAPRQAWLLRLALGWGNEDEVDAVLTPLIRHTVHKALSSVGLIHQPMALS